MGWYAIVYRGFIFAPRWSAFPISKVVPTTRPQDHKYTRRMEIVWNLSHTLLLQSSDKLDVKCEAAKASGWPKLNQPNFYSLKLLSHNLVYLAALIAAGFII